MVAINFPDSPTNGQEHSGYVWDATNNVWNRLPTLPALDLVNFSAVAPSNPQDGQFWFDTTAGKMYVYYNDGSSAQWVSTLGGLVGQTGTEGQRLIHNGTEWVAYDGGSRNLLYNGAMQVAQRGTSKTGITTNNYFTADRWRSALNAGTWTQTVEADGPAGSGFTKSLKTECTTAVASPGAGDVVIIQQNLEGLDLQGIKKGTSEAESLTLSFWVKSNYTSPFIVELNDPDNSRFISASVSVSSSGVWEKKTITFDGDTLGVLDNNNATSIQLNFWLTAGSTYSGGTLNSSWGTAVDGRAAGIGNLAASTGNYWQITGVQLETGEVATPFEHKSYGVELAECQRYYTSFGGSQPFEAMSELGLAISTTRVYFAVSLPTKMRVRPLSISYSNLELVIPGTANYAISSLALAGIESGNNKVIVDATTTGLTQYRPYILRAANNLNARLAFYAEL